MKFSKTAGSLALVLAAVFCGTSAFAAEIRGAAADIDPDSGKVTISGSHSDGEYGIVTVSVLNGENLYYWSETNAETDGRFSFSYTMSEEDEPGMYTVKIGGTGITENVTASYPYLSDLQKKKILDSINSCTEAGAIRDIVEKYGEMFGVELGEGSDFSTLSNGDAVWSAMLGKNFKSLTEVKSFFDTATAIETFNEGTPAVDVMNTLVGKFGGILGLAIGNDSYYAAIKNDSEKLRLAENIIGKSFAPEDAKSLCDVFLKTSALCVINGINTSDRDKLISYIEKINADQLAKISLESYNKLSNSPVKQEYAIKLTVNSAPFTGLEKFSEVFENACKKAADYNPYSRGTPGGGGSSRGNSTRGSNSSPSTPNIVLPLLDANKNSDKFSDMDSAAWAKDAVNSLAEAGIVNGDGNGNFIPNADVTRSEFIKMIVCALDIHVGDTKTGDTKFNFDDVTPEMWQYNYVAAAAEAGITNGIFPGKFGTNEKITREDMCVMAARALKTCGVELKFQRDSAQFEDENTISDYARDSVEMLYRAEIINGMDGNFAPKAVTTRAMAAKVIYGIMKEGGLI